MLWSPSPSPLPSARPSLFPSVSPPRASTSEGAVPLVMEGGISVGYDTPWTGNNNNNNRVSCDLTYHQTVLPFHTSVAVFTSPTSLFPRAVTSISTRSLFALPRLACHHCRITCSNFTMSSGNVESLEMTSSDRPKVVAKTFHLLEMGARS